MNVDELIQDHDLSTRHRPGTPRRMLLMLLALAHLPWLVIYWLGLWNQQHYQFFPFALGAFALLFAKRRSRTIKNWSVLSSLLVGFDILCLAAGVALNSPWIVAVGMMAWLFAWCINQKDEGHSRSLGYLILLPLMTLRLPLNSDEQVIHWLQRITTSIASRLLDQMGMLHFREGNVIQFPGKSFLVAEACSGVQSLFTILFLAALVISLRRRSIAHGILLLISGFAFAGIMNVARVMTIAVAWEKYHYDWSVGFTHELLGYCCLIAAAALLMSADAFLEFLLDRVPDVRRMGTVAFYRNPLIAAWNRCFVIGYEGTDAASNLDAYGEKRRELPHGIDLLKPHFWFHFLFGFADSWSRTRKYRRLLAGFPFIVAAISAMILIPWLRHESDDSITKNYRRGLIEAQKDQDPIREETYLKALSGLRGQEAEYRFQLALFLIKQGKVTEGLSIIRTLTPEQTDGYSPARLWLVRQALQPQPSVSLDRDAIERQLLIVLKQQPDNADVHELLSRIYVERREFQLAERHLTEAARRKPELNLKLAVLKKSLNRDLASVRTCGQKAVEFYMKQLQLDRNNAPIRVALAEAMYIAGQETAARETAARETLVAGLQQTDDPLLKKTLAEFDVMMIDRGLKNSPLNRDASVPVAIAALKLDPSSVAACQLITTLKSMGAIISAENMQPAISYWETALSNDSSNQNSRIILSQLHLSAGNAERAVEVMTPVVESRPELRMALARMLLQANRTEEAIAALQTLSEEALTILETNNADEAAAAIHAEAMLLVGRSEEARGFLLTLSADQTINSVPKEPKLEALYGQSCLAEFDRLTGLKSSGMDAHDFLTTEIPTEADRIAMLELLRDALKCRATIISAIDRLALLSFSKHSAANDAAGMIRQLQLEGDFGAEVLNKLGMFALLLNRYPQAQSYLELANARSRGVNPMILNNLAIATVRTDPNAAEAALVLANQTLKTLPNNPDALSTRGEIYVALGRWHEGIADLMDAMKVRPATAEWHRLLEKAYTATSDPEMAAEHARRASELDAAQARR